jgi:hypothetical protein
MIPPSGNTAPVGSIYRRDSLPSLSVSVYSSPSVGRPHTLIRAVISLSLYSTSSHGAVGDRFSEGTFIVQFIVTIYWR